MSALNTLRVIQVANLSATLIAIAYWPEISFVPTYLLGWNACKIDAMRKAQQQ